MSNIDSSTEPDKKIAAVIDIGATSIRMAIAEIDSHGRVHTLESVAQPITLGNDTFTQRRIRKRSIETCVRILRSYRRLLQEYGVTESSQLRVVATSAVREAMNRLAFLDRIYIATGIEVEPLDEAEVNRITYMGIQPQLQADPRLTSTRSMVVEVGGGNTEVLVVKAGNVLFSHTYRLGSLRLLEMIGNLDAAPQRQRAILESQILRVVAQVREHVPMDSPLQMVALGGDMRFAVARLVEDWDSNSLAYLSVERLNEFTREMLALNEDEIAQKYGINYQDAQTVAPALLSYVLLARGFEQDEIAVSGTNLRDGLLQDNAIRDVWTANFRSQIIRSAVSLGRKFDFDEKHARHVATLSRKLFSDLADEHLLEPRKELILYLAALLHEIGLYINTRSNHKHAMYLIRNSEMFGLSRRDVLLIALVARYHRRSSPQPQHDGYSTLNRFDRITVSKLAAILRLAIALDDSRSQRIKDIQCRTDGKKLVMTATGVEDVSLEQLALRQSGSLFEEVYGMQVQIRAAAKHH